MSHAMRDKFRDGHEIDWARLERLQREWLPLADVWWALAGAPVGARVADVGCGAGVFAARYAELGADVTAMDQHAGALARLPAAPRLRAVAADAEGAPLPNGPYEVVFLTDVLHHAHAPDALLRHLRASARMLVLGEFDPEGEGEFGPGPEHRLRKEDVLTRLRDAGWRPDAPVQAPYEHYGILAR